MMFMTAGQALAEVTREPLSFLHIDRPETWFDNSVDMYAPQVYEKAGQALKEWISDGYFIRDSRPCYYIYEQVMDGRAQTGIVACASVNDYVNNVIKKHENTREAKSRTASAISAPARHRPGPIFLAYRHDPSINEIMAKAMAKSPVYDFITP